MWGFLLQKIINQGKKKCMAVSSPIYYRTTSSNKSAIFSFFFSFHWSFHFLLFNIHLESSNLKITKVLKGINLTFKSVWPGSRSHKLKIIKIHSQNTRLILPFLSKSPLKPKRFIITHLSATLTKNEKKYYKLSSCFCRSQRSREIQWIKLRTMRTRELLPPSHQAEVLVALKECQSFLPSDQNNTDNITEETCT